MVTWFNFFKDAAQEIRSAWFTLEVDTKMTIMVVNHRKYFFVAFMTYYSPRFVKGMVFVSIGIGQTIIAR